MIVSSPRPGVPPPGKSSGLYAFFTTKDGKRIYAKDYGYKAWPIGKRGPNSKSKKK